MNGKPLSAIEREYLCRTYPDTPTAEIAAALGRPAVQVYGHAKKLGLKKSKVYLEEKRRSEAQRLTASGRAHRFKPGQVPANKGTRRPGWAPGNMAQTQFKKGQPPRNWFPVGTIKMNTDGYLRIKVSGAPEPVDGKGGKSKNWEFVHKRVWVAAHGPIPKGHRIWWKDGNHENCALENLELLSDVDHMARTTIHNFPPELKQVIQLKGAVNRTVTMRKRKANAQEPA